MDNKVTFCIVRLYNEKNGTLDLSRRAICKVDVARPSGTPVRFSEGGKNYCGDVLESFETQDGSELYKLLATLAGQNVQVYFPPAATVEEINAARTHI